MEWLVDTIHWGCKQCPNWSKTIKRLLQWLYHSSICSSVLSVLSIIVLWWFLTWRYQFFLFLSCQLECLYRHEIMYSSTWFLKDHWTCLGSGNVLWFLVGIHDWKWDLQIHLRAHHSVGLLPWTKHHSSRYLASIALLSLDIKPSNIFLSNHHILLGDFGLSKEIQHSYT